MSNPKTGEASGSDRIRKILVPTDFSEASSAALEFAAAIAHDQQGELLIVHVSPPRSQSEADSPTLDPDTAALHRLLDETQPQHRQVPFRRLAWHGDPAPTIVAGAEREGVDLIVIATHGRSGISRLLLGSVAESVVRRARCPVLTLRS